MRVKLCAVLLSGATVLAACSSTADSSPSPTPSPTVMSKSEAGQFYLKVNCPANRVEPAWRRAIGGHSYSALLGKKDRGEAAIAARKMRDAAEQLVAPPLPWPADVQKSIDGVVADMLDEVSVFVSFSTATSKSDLLSAYKAWQKLGTSTNRPAQRARLLLGLPVAGSTKDGCNGSGVAVKPSPSQTA